jgi:hypothetical protein
VNVIDGWFDMADFSSWRTENLVSFCFDSQNERALIVSVLVNLMKEYETTCDQFCKTPSRNEAYRTAKKLLEKT